MVNVSTWVLEAIRLAIMTQLFYYTKVILEYYL